MQRFRKKPVVIEAIQWKGDNLDEIKAFSGRHVFTDVNGLYIHTKEGHLRASLDDWIIQGVAGEFYPCKPDIFEKTYEGM